MLNTSIIIPVYNEEGIIKEVLDRLKDYQAEIIVVNDGSTDNTGKILENIEGIKVISHPYNKGYGASLKTGVKNTQSDWILFYDGDGQHQPKHIEKLLENRNGYDMVVGARQGYQGPLSRQPGKKVLHWLANYLVGQKIPDLNSGLRLIKKDLFLKFAHILPNGFSLSTTITLAFFREGYNIRYMPIAIDRRKGKSSVKIKDGFKTLITILRMIMLFSPLRVFLPVSLSLFTAFFASAVYDVFIRPMDVTDLTVLLFIASMLIFFFGLLADQVSAVRRELNQ